MTTARAMLLALGLATGAGAEPMAVGRLSYSTGPASAATACTGTLVAPDLVLTALHCLLDRTGAPRDPASVLFAPGWAAGEAAAVLAGAEIIPARPRGLAPALELALLRLAAPAPVAPIGLAPPADGPFLTLGYDRRGPPQLARHEGCHLIGRPAAMLALDCPAVSGHSGGPVLQDGALVAVMVGRGTGTDPVGTYAALAPADLVARLSSP